MVLALLAGSRLVLGQETLDPTKIDLLPLEEEVAMALSAAPGHLRDGTTVWALTADGYVEARSGTNGFSCIINRDHPLNRKPTCYDAEGTAAILPKVRFVGEQLLAGVPLEEVNEQVREGFQSGRFRSTSRPGVAYMLTPHIRTYDPRTGQFGTFPPHVMFYAPNLTNADIGATRGGSGPFVAYQGPHGFMIMIPPEGGE